MGEQGWGKGGRFDSGGGRKWDGDCELLNEDRKEDDEVEEEEEGDNWVLVLGGGVGEEGVKEGGRGRGNVPWVLINVPY